MYQRLTCRGKSAYPHKRTPLYEGSLRRQWIDDLSLVDCRCGPCAGRRSNTELARTQDEYISVLISMAGKQTVTQNDTTATLQSGDVVVWESAKPAEFRIWEPVVKRSLFVPRPALQEISGRHGGANGVTLQSGTAALRFFIDYLAAITCTIPHLPLSALPAVRNATLELLLGAFRADTPIDSADLTAARRAIIERYIDRHLLSDQLTPSAIATAHNVSVRTLQRTFSDTGESLSDVIRRRRLARAREDILSGDHTISLVAHRWGFADASHFTKAFKAHYGTTPREYKQGMTRQL
ncbi:MAG: helix-turn-helix domain-containing protein [Micromonosporaceae bacterium]|nr:helix-turn-helix domain-containing protein [Micromonosporaceae bacterium]